MELVLTYSSTDGGNREFDTLADVNAYAVHPDHVAAAGLLKEVKADRACVDYEF